MAKRSPKAKRRYSRVAHAISSAVLLSANGVAKSSIPAGKDDGPYAKGTLVFAREGGEICFGMRSTRWYRLSELTSRGLKNIARCKWEPCEPTSPLQLLARTGK